MKHLQDAWKREPSAQELAAIELEWPVIAAELALLDAEIVALIAGDELSPLDWRRVRRAERQVLRVAAATAALHGGGLSSAIDALAASDRKAG